MADFDNTNRGALWPAKGFAGTIDLSGEKHYIMLVATGAKDANAPAYQAVIRHDNVTQCFPVFRNKKEEGKSLAHGQYFGHWVHVFLNEKSENPNAPTLRLSAQPVDATPAVAQQPKRTPEEELPF
jgi:hypothetical protein